MCKWYIFINILLEQYGTACVRCRALAIYIFKGYLLKKIGHSCKIKGSSHIVFGKNVCIGDYCWIEAVCKYQGKFYQSKLTIGDNVALSDLSHISCAGEIDIGSDCLIGSKVFIGDHHHGSINNHYELLNVPPAQRDLGDIKPIVIGNKCWICDGVVILGGTKLAASSIVGANSVVKIIEERSALIAGIPAKVIRYFD